MSRLVLALVALLVLLVAAFAVFFFFAARDFEARAERILVDLSEGEIGPVYDGASRRFRDRFPYEDFEAYVAYRREALGAFRRILGARDLDPADLPDVPDAGGIELDLEYERGVTRGEFHFVEEEGEWRLLRLQVHVPHELTPQPDPARLGEAARAAARSLGEGRVDDLAPHVSEEVRAQWMDAPFRAEWEEIRARLGALAEVTLSALEESDEGARVAVLDLEFERGRLEVRLTYRWEQVDWRIVDLAHRER